MAHDRVGRRQTYTSRERCQLPSRWDKRAALRAVCGSPTTWTWLELGSFPTPASGSVHSGCAPSHHSETRDPQGQASGCRRPARKCAPPAEVAAPPGDCEPSRTKSLGTEPHPPGTRSSHKPSGTRFVVRWVPQCATPRRVLQSSSATQGLIDTPLHPPRPGSTRAPTSGLPDPEVQYVLPKGPVRNAQVRARSAYCIA